MAGHKNVYSGGSRAPDLQAEVRGLVPRDGYLGTHQQNTLNEARRSDKCGKIRNVKYCMCVVANDTQNIQSSYWPK